MNNRPGDSSYLNRSLMILVATYSTGLFGLTLLRIILCFTQPTDWAGLPTPILMKAFWMGWRFDTVISAYILALPALGLIIGAFGPILRPIIRRISLIWITALYALALLLGAIDLVYFHFYHTRITFDILKWMNTPGMVLKMVFQDWKNYLVLAGLCLVVSSLYRAFRLWFDRFLNAEWVTAPALRGNRVLSHSLIYVLAAGFIFLGMRGRISPKSPIRWGTAFFSDYTFANQLGLNPSYTFLQSWLDSRNPKNRNLNLMPDSLALAYMQNGLAGIPAYHSDDRVSLVTGPPADSLPPLVREFRPSQPPHEWNVVLVLMESMAAWKMGVFGNPDRLTPHLDSLAQSGQLLTRFYSDGTHTCNGVFASLFGYPTLMSKHPLKSTENMQIFGGIPHLLNQRGYHTVFFCTHDDQFDNLGGFLSHNGFQKIVSQRDYPRDKVINTFGVPDGVMFDQALPYLNQLHQSGQPFLAVLLTDSDHSPYTIPEHPEFKPHSDDKAKQATEYADWAIGRFMRQTAREAWFENTVFLFTADHGQYSPSPYDISLGFHHIPLIIYPQDKCAIPDSDALGCQVDILPTLMGILRIPYRHNTMGYDLTREKRSMVIFNDDDKLSCLNDSLLWLSRKNHAQSLYRYREGNLSQGDTLSREDSLARGDTLSREDSLARGDTLSREDSLAGGRALVRRDKDTIAIGAGHSDIIATYPGEAAVMSDYARAQLQTVQWLINQRKVYVELIP